MSFPSRRGFLGILGQSLPGWTAPASNEGQVCKRLHFPAALAQEKRMQMTDTHFTSDIRAISIKDAEILSENVLNAQNAFAANQVLSLVRTLKLIRENNMTLLDHAVRAANLAYADTSGAREWVAAALCANVGRVVAPANPWQFAAEMLKPFVNVRVYLALRFRPVLMKDPQVFQKFTDVLQKQPWFHGQLAEDSLQLQAWIKNGFRLDVPQPCSFSDFAAQIRSLYGIGLAHVIFSKKLHLVNFKVPDEKAMPSDAIDRFLREQFGC